MYSSMCDFILEKYWHHQIIPEKGLDGMIVFLWSRIISCNLQYQVYLVNLYRAVDLVDFPDGSDSEVRSIRTINSQVSAQVKLCCQMSSVQVSCCSQISYKM